MWVRGRIGGWFGLVGVVWVQVYVYGCGCVRMGKWGSECVGKWLRGKSEQVRREEGRIEGMRESRKEGWKGERKGRNKEKEREKARKRKEERGKETKGMKKRRVEKGREARRGEEVGDRR